MMFDHKLTITRCLSAPDSISNDSSRVETQSNVWLVAHGSDAILVDAGFASEQSLACILQAIRRQKLVVKSLYITHGHPDHVLGAPRLAHALGCSVHCHPLEAQLIRANLGSARSDDQDHDELRLRLTPDLVEGHSLTLGSVTCQVLHTPGHTHGHIAIWFPATGDLFPGDTILPLGSVWIGPPDGHISAYLASLDRLTALAPVHAHCGHGETVADPKHLIAAMRARRLLREAQVRHHLRAQEWTIQKLTVALYGEMLRTTAQRMVAERTMLAHVQRLEEQGEVVSRYDRAQGRLLYRSHSL